jgi:hypothetical protein
MITRTQTGIQQVYPQINVDNKPEEKEQTTTETQKDRYLSDCYKKLSDKDVPMMKGDWGPRITSSYQRWDQDLQAFDKREAGSLQLKRRDTKVKSLSQKYREFAEINADVSLGSLRGFYGVVGLNAIRKEIRENGIPDQFRA